MNNPKMLVLYITLLLSIYKEIVGIDCIYSEEEFFYSFDNFIYEDFENKINDIRSYDYQNDNINMCRVEIFIDYQNRSITINFADSFPWSELDDGEGRLDFLITLNQTNTEYQYFNVLEYACYDESECDKEFVFKNIPWLLQANYSIFASQLRMLLLTNSTKTEKCFIDKINTINCPDGICLGKYSSYYHNYYFECHQNSDAPVEVHITTTMTMESTIDKNQMIRYTCKFNQCNNQSLTDSLKNIVQEYYPLTEMKDAFLSTDYYYSTGTPMQISKAEYLFPSSTINNEGLSLNKANKYFFILINLILFDI